MQIKWNKVPYFIDNAEIVYIERNHRNTIIHTADKTYRTTAILDELMKQLGSSFVRCHKSFIVQVNQIRSATFHSITLKNGTEVPVARSCHSKVDEIISSLLDIY